MTLSPSMPGMGGTSGVEPTARISASTPSWVTYSGVTEIIDAKKKVQLLQQYREDLGLQNNQVLAVGDGANDIPMIQAAGIGVAFHAKPKTQAAASVSVNFCGLNGLLWLFRDE